MDVNVSIVCRRGSVFTPRKTEKPHASIWEADEDRCESWTWFAMVAFLFSQQSLGADIQNAWTIYIQYISHMSRVCHSRFHNKTELIVCWAPPPEPDSWVGILLLFVSRAALSSNQHAETKRMLLRSLTYPEVHGSDTECEFPAATLAHFDNSHSSYSSSIALLPKPRSRSHRFSLPTLPTPTLGLWPLVSDTQGTL